LREDHEAAIAEKDELYNNAVQEPQELQNDFNNLKIEHDEQLENENNRFKMIAHQHIHQLQLSRLSVSNNTV
jgi:cell division protein FtsL